MNLGQTLANFPAWLKIVGIIVIVLGVIVLVVGGVRAGGDKAEPSPSPGSGISIFAAVPANEIELSGGCSRSVVAERTQFTGGSCTFKVKPNGLAPRELRLTRTAGSGLMSVSQVIRNETRSPDASPIPGAIGVSIPSGLAVPVAGVGDVTVTMNCFPGSCTFVLDDR